MVLCASAKRAYVAGEKVNNNVVLTWYQSKWKVIGEGGFELLGQVDTEVIVAVCAFIFTYLLLPCYVI